MRKSTERPQVYDVGSSVKFDPAKPEEFRPPLSLRNSSHCSGKRGSIRSVRWALVSANCRRSPPPCLLRMISRATSQSTITFRLRAPTVTMVCKSAESDVTRVSVVPLTPIAAQQHGARASRLRSRDRGTTAPEPAAAIRKRSGRAARCRARRAS